MVRIALAYLRFPVTPAESISLAAGAIAKAATAGAQIVCFPEEFVPGYRLGPHSVASTGPEFLENAW